MNNLMKALSFTKNEIKVILFIISVLAAGFSIKYYKQVISSGSLLPFDYTKSDSEFREKSQNAGTKLSITGTDNSEESDEKLFHSLKSSDDSLQQKLKSLKEENFSGAALNINTAGRDDLIDLPGIGESTADKIIQYRESKKGFKKIEDIMNVSGIGKKKFEKLKNHIKAE